MVRKNSVTENTPFYLFYINKSVPAVLAEKSDTMWYHSDRNFRCLDESDTMWYHRKNTILKYLNMVHDTTWYHLNRNIRTSRNNEVFNLRTVLMSIMERLPKRLKVYYSSLSLSLSLSLRSTFLVYCTSGMVSCHTIPSDQNRYFRKFFSGSSGDLNE